MKLRLITTEERRKELEAELIGLGIEPDDSAGLILGDEASLRALFGRESGDAQPKLPVLADASAEPVRKAYLPVRDSSGERLNIPADSIIFIESCGHSVNVHAEDGVYSSPDRLYRLEEVLDRRRFIRVSSSVIAARKKIRKIRPTLSQKFILTMSDGTLVDVTRSYYSSFRDAFGI